MDSLDLQLWTRIAALNRAVCDADPCLQRRDWEDAEFRQIFQLCVLQISVLILRVMGRSRTGRGAREWSSPPGRDHRPGARRLEE